MSDSLISLTKNLSSASRSDLEALDLLLEEAEYRKARSNFLDFVKLASHEPPPARHHRIKARILQDVLDGKVKRVMFFEPPGHAKTTYSTILFPPFWMGHNPRKRAIIGSYNDDLATEFGSRAKMVVESEEYQRIFGLHIDRRLGDSKGHWGLDNISELFACGVGSGVTGRRADLIDIDDPIKDKKEADSEVYRNNVWNWYLTSLRTRMKPDAAILINMTRWHEDDLPGRILGDKWKGESGWWRAYDGEMWLVICWPALAEENDPLQRKPGEALWPDYYTREYLETVRRGLPERDWNALYQQKPSPDEGIFFKREWIQFYDDPPQHMRTYLSTDFAVTNEGGDFSEIGVGRCGSAGQPVFARLVV